MFASPVTPESRVAIFLDCDNANPANLEYAVQVAQGLGRVVVRRGYGNHVTLASKWQKTLMQQSFAPCLQFQYASGKNTADIALAIDVMEVLLEKRADTFVLVTSDSDFVGLSQKIKERGAAVHIVGEVKSPDSLRRACDQFFECATPEPPDNSCPVPFGMPKSFSYGGSGSVGRSYPSFVVTELGLLLNERQAQKVTLASFGAHLKAVNPAFDPKIYGHEKLSNMLKGYTSGIVMTPDDRCHYWVSQPQPSMSTPLASPVPALDAAPEPTLDLSPDTMMADLQRMVTHAGQQLSNRLRAPIDAELAVAVED